ncbi:MAG: hypothetical protein KDI44_00105 [Thiothrix sp.]|nr:hypothetical protein [Thiothrix sp.]HPQ94457.1 hypothetical protein [Thiolinea sp.]
MLTHKENWKRLLIHGLLTGLLVVNPLFAAENLSVNLIATLENSPAMESVTWKVYRLDNKHEVTSARNHSTQVQVPPGSYRVVATLKTDDKTVIRERSFHVRTNSSNVVVPMD